jgi:hypothetical protein
MPDLITVNVSPTPSGQGAATTNAFGVQSIRGSFAWSGTPSQATITFVDNGAAAFTGQFIEISLGNHYFAGLCQSDTGNVSSKGGLREMLFVDLREFLKWDYVYCAFNMPIRRWVNGVWKKRWWHVYPSDFDTMTKTFTDTPLAAWQIVGALFTAPTVGSPWAWNLTGNGMFPGGLMNQPVFSFDCLTGVRLDAALNDISARGGLVFTLDAKRGAPYRLVWMRKGYGLVPVLPPFDWPPNSDDRRIGLSLSGNATNIRVIGERNRYQVLNVPLTPDWNRAWEAFVLPDALYLDIFNNEKDPQSGVPYNSFPNDPENWIGANAAKVRSLQITVAEYVAMRNARPSADGDQFIDRKKFSGRSRMDMPAALYIATLLYRAYVPAVTGITNRNGHLIGLDSVNILDAMPCMVTYDPVTGTMEADPSTLTDGNGLAIVQGTMFGQDLFELVKPERISGAFFSANNRPWGAVSFQIDDSGEGQRFIIFEQPCFTSENLLTTVGGYQVLNAAATLAPATAQAALTFELEPYSYWEGTYPNVSRDRAEYVSGLFAELVGTAGNYVEIPYGNGYLADDQASQIAQSLLLCQYTYISGGYRNIQANSPLGTPLTSIIDRVDVDFNPRGFMELVDFTTERERATFEPERDLERRTLQNSLFPGQDKLRRETREFQRLGAGLRSLAPAQRDQFIQFLKGNLDYNVIPTRFDPEFGDIPAGQLVSVGIPIFKPPTDTSTNPPTNTLATYPSDVDPSFDSVFLGVTSTHNQNANGIIYVVTGGETLAWVQGPIKVNDQIGADPDGYADYDTTNVAYLMANTQAPVGTAMQAITDTNVHLIKVYLTPGGGSGGSTWLP